MMIKALQVNLLGARIELARGVDRNDRPFSWCEPTKEVTATFAGVQEGRQCPIPSICATLLVSGFDRLYEEFGCAFASC